MALRLKLHVSFLLPSIVRISITMQSARFSRRIVPCYAYNVVLSFSCHMAPCFSCYRCYVFLIQSAKFLLSHSATCLLLHCVTFFLSHSAKCILLHSVAFLLPHRDNSSIFLGNGQFYVDRRNIFFITKSCSVWTVMGHQRTVAKNNGGKRRALNILSKKK